MTKFLSLATQPAGLRLIVTGAYTGCAQRGRAGTLAGFGLAGQLAKQASALASATRKLPLLEIGVAVAAPVKTRNNIVRNSDFIGNLPTSTRKAFGHRSLMHAFDGRWRQFRPCL